MVLRSSRLYSGFFIVLLGTEFIHVEVMGGVVRPYHFITPAVILLLYRFAPRVLKTPVFWALVAFWITNLISAVLAADPTSALKGFGLLSANMSIAVATALILTSGIVSLERAVTLVVYVAIAGVLLGVLQVAAYHLSGVSLALSPTQEGQIRLGFSSGFRTEANAFGKNLNVALLLALPVLLRGSRRRWSVAVTTLLVIGMLTSLTRSALYGLSIALVLGYFWYQFTGRGRVIAPRAVNLLAIGAVGLFVFASVAPDFNTYAAHKLAFFFDAEEISAGDSSGYRLMAQSYLWNAFLSNDHSILVGTGWGQVTFGYGGVEKQAGGGELVTALAYGGIFGGLAYISYNIVSLWTAGRALRRRRTTGSAGDIEGVLLALIGVLVTGQINGALIAPEYWMLFGMAIYLAYSLRAGKLLSNQCRV